MSRFITDGKMYLVQLCKYKHKYSIKEEKAVELSHSDEDR